MAEKVVFKKNRKPLPIFLKLGLFLFVLGALVAFVLSLVYNLTKPYIEASLEKEKEAENQAIYALLEGYNIQEVEDETSSFELARIDSKDSSEVLAIYQGKLEEDVVFAFKVSSTNVYTTFNTLVVVKEKDKQVVFTKVLSDATTLGKVKNDAFYDSTFNLEGANDTNYKDQFAIITSSTFSSKSVLQACKVAYLQLEIIEGVEK